MSSTSHSKAVVSELLLIHCLLLSPLFVGVFMVGPCFVVHYLVSSFAIISLEKKDSWLLYLIAFKCHLTVSVLCLFLTVLWVGLQCVIVAFHSHTHFCSCDLLSLILNPPTVSTIRTALL